MKTYLSLLLCVILSICLFAGCGEQPQKPGEARFDQFSVGYAKADITPPVNTGVMLVGNNDHTERLATEVLEPLFATCIAFTDTEGTTILLYGLDLHNTAGPVCQEVRDKLTELTGIPGSHIQFNATHTHAGPSQTHTANHTVTAYNEMFVEKCVKIGQEALADRKPAEMFTTFCRPEGLNHVRHYVLLDGTYRGKDMGSVKTADIVGHTLKSDNLLQLVKFTREGGKDVVMINWQAHYRGNTTSPTSDPDHCYTGVSADYPGVMRRVLNDALGCESLFILGGSGNMTTGSAIPAERLQVYDYIDAGTKLANAAAAAAVNFQPAETGKIHLTENLYVVEGTRKEIPLYTFGFGDFAMALAPFEIFQQNVIPVRDSSKYKMTFYASCANASAGMRYLPATECFSYYNYETGVTIYNQGTAEIIQAQLTNMLEQQFTASGGTEKEKGPGYITEPYVPQTDSVEYANPSPGNPDAAIPVKNGRYNVTLAGNGKITTFLVETKEVADAIVAKETVKLLFDERNVVVGIVE